MLGRKQELIILNKLLSMNSLEIVLLQGKHQSGKTTLINEFAKRKYKAYYSVHNSTNSCNSSYFISEMNCQGLIRDYSVTSLIDALRLIANHATKDKFILAIDNAHFIQRNFPELLSNLINILSEQIDSLRFLLIFSGEDLTYIRSKLYNFQEKISEIYLDPLSYQESCEYLDVFDDEDKVLLYGVTNGHPLYLSYIDSQKNLRENLFNLFYRENAPLLNIGETVLNALLRQPSVYHTVLAAVANGASHMKDIARQTNINDNILSKYINALLS